MTNKTRKRKELKPLKVSCTDYDCDNELHCFKKSRSMLESEVGQCRSCGADPIDWGRVHQRNLSDVSNTFASLKLEFVRYHFWNVSLDQKAINHARRKGREKLREAVQNRIVKYIAPATPSYDGRQTPTNGNVIYYAQHALACCCRTCLEYWHGIPKGRELTVEQTEYLVDIVMMYVGERLPDLTETGEYVPPIRRSIAKEDG